MGIYFEIELIGNKFRKVRYRKMLVEKLNLLMIRHRPNRKLVSEIKKYKKCYMRLKDKKNFKNSILRIEDEFINVLYEYLLTKYNKDLIDTLVFHRYNINTKNKIKYSIHGTSDMIILLNEGNILFDNVDHKNYFFEHRHLNKIEILDEMKNVCMRRISLIDPTIKDRKIPLSKR